MAVGTANRLRFTAGRTGTDKYRRVPRGAARSRALMEGVGESGPPMTGLHLRVGAFEVRVTDVQAGEPPLDEGAILHARSGPGEPHPPAWPAAAWDVVRALECRASGQLTGRSLVRYHCLIADLDHEDALVVGDQLLLLVDDSVLAFELPSLRIRWRSLVAEQIPWCFRIVPLPACERVLIHCEWEIGCLDLDGNRVWHTNEFADILTGPSHLDGNAYVVEDFNGWRYRVALDTGETVLVNHRDGEESS